MISTAAASCQIALGKSTLPLSGVIVSQVVTDAVVAVPKDWTRFMGTANPPLSGITKAEAGEEPKEHGVTGVAEGYPAVPGAHFFGACFSPIRWSLVDDGDGGPLSK